MRTPIRIKSLGAGKPWRLSQSEMFSRPPRAGSVAVAGISEPIPPPRNHRDKNKRQQTGTNRMKH